MQEIIEKRTQLLNYFFNEDKEYSKLDILNKEYSALSFSPREEFIDSFTTEYAWELMMIHNVSLDEAKMAIAQQLVNL